MGLCLCLCLSVTSRSSTKTAKQRITKTTPHDSPWTLVSVARDLREIRPGSPPTRAPNAGGWVKIGDFRQITGYVSKTVQGKRTKSSLKGAWSGFGEPFYNFTPRVISSQRLMLETSNFVHGSAMQSLSLVMSECFLSGRGQGHVSNFYIVDLENFATASRSVYR